METEQLKAGYEQVFTVADYYDRPCKGIANYRGQPHLDECVFDEAIGDYSELFQLTPFPTEVFQLAIEDWNIFRRWEMSFHAGQTDISTHPALLHDTRRLEELKQILESRLVTDPARAILKLDDLNRSASRRSQRELFGDYRWNGRNREWNRAAQKLTSDWILARPHTPSGCLTPCPPECFS